MQLHYAYIVNSMLPSFNHAYTILSILEWRLMTLTPKGVSGECKKLSSRLILSTLCLNSICKGQGINLYEV